MQNVFALLAFLKLASYSVANSNECRNVSTGGFQRLECFANLLADPCKDFYSYACGKYVAGDYGKNHPEYVYDRLDRIRSYIKTPLSKGKPRGRELKAFKTARQLFKSCVSSMKNSTKFAEAKLNEARGMTKQFGGWPLLKPDGGGWKPSKKAFEPLLARLAQEGQLLEVKYDSSHDSITLGSGAVPLSSLCFNYSRNTKRNTKTLAQCTNGYAEGLESTAKKIAITDDIQLDELEIERLNATAQVISLAAAAKHSPTEYYITLEELLHGKVERPLNLLNWNKFFNHLNGDKFPITEERRRLKRETSRLQASQITVYYGTFLEELLVQMSGHEPRVWQNFLLGLLLAKHMNEETITGVENIADHCTDKVLQLMPHVADRLLIDQVNESEELLTDIRNGMTLFSDRVAAAADKMINSAKWIKSAKDKKLLRQKLKTMGRRLVFPEKLLNDNLLEQYYKKLDLKPTDSLFTAQRKIRELEWSVNAEKLFHTSKAAELTNLWRVIDEEASYTSNELTISLGALMGMPNFIAGVPNAVYYGAVAFTIGHEVFHGFDSLGALTDEHSGNLSKATLNEFEKRSKCVVEQYNRLCYPRGGLCVDGANTMSENIADIAGIKAALKAYKADTSAVESDSTSELLPPGLTAEQSFFVAFAQSGWCSVTNDDDIREAILEDVHAPNRWRIIGPLQNMPEFAKAFHCKLETPMNPKKKCTIW